MSISVFFESTMTPGLSLFALLLWKAMMPGKSESDYIWLCSWLWPFGVTFPLLRAPRAYMSVKELKEALRLNSTHFLNVYFASSVREDLAGAATWPWDKEAISHLGKQSWRTAVGEMRRLEGKPWKLVWGEMGRKINLLNKLASLGWE